MRENEVAILKKAERSMVKAMCVKLVDKRNAVELMDMLGLKEAANKLARANGVRWYSHVLRQSEEDVLMKTREHEVDGKRKQGRPKMKWTKQVEGNMRRIGFSKEDPAYRYRWREGVERVLLSPFTDD